MFVIICDNTAVSYHFGYLKIHAVVTLNCMQYITRVHCCKRSTIKTLLCDVLYMLCLIILLGYEIGQEMEPYLSDLGVKLNKVQSDYVYSFIMMFFYSGTESHAKFYSSKLYTMQKLSDS